MKKTALIVALLMILAILGGCAQEPANVQPTETAEVSASPTPSAIPETAEAAVTPMPSASRQADEPSAPVQSCETAEAVSQAPSGTVEEIIATGIYQGQADNNFIEIKIDGQDEDTAYMVFMLTGAIKDNFEDLDLNTGDSVALTYYKNEAGQLVLTQFSLLSYG